MSLRVRLAAAFAVVAVLTALAIALTAPTIVGRGFAAMAGTDPAAGSGSGMGHGNGTGGTGGAGGTGAGMGVRAVEIQADTTRTIMVVALVGAGLASLLGLALATRLTRPLGRLEHIAAQIAAGHPEARSGLADRRDEIGSLARSLDGMAGDLQAADQARRRFFQDAAHELKTPLAVIDATTSAVLDGVYPNDPRHLETILAQSRLMARIVDDLRTVSLAEARALPLRREPVDAAGILAAVATDMRARATTGSLEIHVEGAPGLLVQADPDRLRQVLSALVDNALRHTPAGGTVTLTAALEGPIVRLAVADTGPGIAAGDLPHVFERFYQADVSRDRGTGTSGLGLAIVQALVEAQGGRTSARNGANGGAVFEVRLPVLAR